MTADQLDGQPFPPAALDAFTQGQEYRPLLEFDTDYVWPTASFCTFCLRQDQSVSAEPVVIRKTAHKRCQLGWLTTRCADHQ